MKVDYRDVNSLLNACNEFLIATDQLKDLNSFVSEARKRGASEKEISIQLIGLMYDKLAYGN